MNTTPTDEVVLKQDVLGRVKTPKVRREQLLDEFERSGLNRIWADGISTPVTCIEPDRSLPQT